jgi:hypothetical protein
MMRLFLVSVIIVSVYLGSGEASGEPPRLKLLSADARRAAVDSVKKLGWYAYEESDPLEDERIPFFTTSTPATDADLLMFPGFPSSFGLNLSGSKVTDDGIKRLAMLEDLRVLHLDAVRSVSDRGMKSLAPIKSLVELHVSSPLITDEGISHLARCDTLCKLFISQTTLDDNGLRELAKLPRLQFLDISGTRITNAGLGDIKQFPALEHLSLGGTSISDDGVERLVGYKKLKSLDLSLTKITDGGLRHVGKLENQ